MEIVVIETKELGDRSYLVTDGACAVVVDPQRDVERVTAAADERGVRITHVVETHVHNDYLSGGLLLARRTGARYGVAAAEAVAFGAERDPLADGDGFEVGELTGLVVATPGHTPHHLSYVVTDRNGEVAVFSGGSLLYGAAGRTDLAGTGLTETLARAQWDSVRRLASILPAEATVHPTHGFGSFCAAGGGAGTGSSTVGHERCVNPALVLGQQAFVEDLIGRLSVYPRYYAHMAPRNRAGVAAASLTPVPAGTEEILGRLQRGEWVVDVCDRRAFASAHLPGTINVELGDQLATYLGWVFPWGSPLSLVADGPDQLASARRHLARIGLEDVVAERALVPGDLAGSLTRSYPVARFADLDHRLARGAPVLVLDVRHPHEWSAGHLAGAWHIPVQDLAGALGTLPRDRRVWVHCAAGYRAALASSLLDREGIPVTLVNDRCGQAATRAAA